MSEAELTINHALHLVLYVLDLVPESKRVNDVAIAGLGINVGVTIIMRYGRPLRGGG